MQNYVLQSVGEWIAGGATDFASGLSSGIGTIAVIVLVLAFGFLGLIGFILFKKRFDFEGRGEPIGHYNIEIMGKYALIGNIAEYQMVDDEELELLKQEPELQAVPDVIRQMYKEKTLWIYTMKSPDDTDILDKFGNRTFIISSGDLKSSVYAYQAQKGKLTFRSIFTKEKTTKIVAYSSAKKMQILNEDRHIDDWWLISPMPIVANKQEIGFDSRAVGGMRHYIEVREISNAKALATALDFIPFVTDALLKNESLKKQLEKTEKSLADRTQQLGSTNMKYQKKKMQLGQKDYVIYKKTETEQLEKQNVIMMIVAVVMGAVSVMFVPDFFPNLSEQSAQFLAMVIGIIIIGGMAYTMNKRKPEKIEVDPNE